MQTLNPAATAMAAQDARVHALDHLRAFAMLAGVFFHAALAYSPLVHTFWPTAYRHSSAWVDALIWMAHLVRMPLFFLVSGYFTAWLIARRGVAGLMRQRSRRILVPLLVAWPIITLALATLTEQAMAHVANPSPFLGMMRQWMALPDPPRMPPSTGHLWFLYYLLLFTVLAWIGRTLGWGVILEKMLRLGPVALALLLPLMVAPGFLLTTTPHPAPESLFPQFWAFVLYGSFFAVGAMLCDRLDWLQPLRRWLWLGVAMSLLLYVALLVQWERFGMDDWARQARWPVALTQAGVAAWGTLACLVAGLKWLREPNRWLAYLSRSAYWTYLLHLPVLLAFQYAMLDRNWPWPMAWLASIALTLCVCLLSYEMLIRRTRLARWVG